MSSDSAVHFRFVGEDSGLSIDVAVPRKALEAVPESLLTKLADNIWNRGNPELGRSAMLPIETHPLLAECKDEWSPALAAMIVNAYLFAAKKRPNENKEPLKLPPGVDLVDALVVLDYYGERGRSSSRY